MNKEIELMKNTQCKNKRGEWVTCIEVPYFLIFRKRCRCGRKFWTMKGYKEHYALTHILNY